METTQPTPGDETNYGTVEVREAGQPTKVLRVVDYLQADYADHRLISFVGIEGDAVLVSVENPPSSGRSTQHPMHLSQESLVGLVVTGLMYMSAKGMDMEAVMKKAAGEEISFRNTPNLKHPILKP